MLYSRTIFCRFLRDKGEGHSGASESTEQAVVISPTLPADVLRLVNMILKPYMGGGSFDPRVSGKAVLVLLLRYMYSLESGVYM